MSIDWGSVPDWLAGIGAVTALLFARSAVRSARETNRGQAEQIRRLEADRSDREARLRAQQASSVTLWFSVRTEDGVPQPVIRLVNSSGLPVYSVLMVFDTPVGATTKAYAVVGPTDGAKVMNRATTAVRDLLEDHDFLTMHDDGDLLAACSFRDTAGVWWYRTLHGELHEAADRSAAETGAAARR